MSKVLNFLKGVGKVALGIGKQTGKAYIEAMAPQLIPLVEAALGSGTGVAKMGLLTNVLDLFAKYKENVGQLEGKAPDLTEIQTLAQMIFNGMKDNGTLVEVDKLPAGVGMQTMDGKRSWVISESLLEEEDASGNS